MAIVKMKRVQVIGLDTVREKLLEELMDAGCVQITEEKPEDSAAMSAETADPTPEEQRAATGALDIPGATADEDLLSSYDSRIADAELALETLDHYGQEKHPLFSTRRTVDREDFRKKLSDPGYIEERIGEILALRDEIHRRQEAVNKRDADLLALAPWESYEIPLEEKETAYTVTDMGACPAAADMEGLKQAIEDASDATALQVVSTDREFSYIAITMLKSEAESVREAAKLYGFTVNPFEGFCGTAKEAEEGLREGIEEDKKKIEELGAQIGGMTDAIPDIQCLEDDLVIRRDREREKNMLPATKRTFRFSGWVPVTALSPVTALLDKYECWYGLRDPEPDEEAPVLLKNNGFVTPFESITEMYSLPDYHGVDATPFFSIFYAIFFGLMLSDAGYGLVITIATGLILKKFDLEGLTYKMIKMFFYCGIATVFWGALFGGWFGDFVHAAGSLFGADVNVPPIWFNPIEDPITLLIFSLALGIVHLFLGMGISAVRQIRSGHWFDAFCDVFSWYMLILGAVAWLGLGGDTTGGTIGKYLTIAGALILLVFGGRKKKGIGKVLGGISALYNVTGYLSDILSYARLLALGLATGVSAQVVKTIGTLAGSGVKGVIALVLAFVIGHTFNLAINALGAFVHSSRLQYIEFFGKFYEDGGEPFLPFRKNTKYVKFRANE